MTKLAGLLLTFVASTALAQEPVTIAEKRVPLTEAAVALDANGASALEASLMTTGLTGAPDTPVTNVRIVIKNTSETYYIFVSGVVTFYDSAGVRCGEGVFKADALAVGESFETDTPGIRIRCAPTTWRLVGANLVPRFIPLPITSNSRFIISVDNEQHPLQLDKPLTLTVGDKKRTIVVREAPPEPKKP